MHLFGVGEAHTHMLSLIFALLAVPAAFFGTRTLFGNKAGWTAALLAALCPYLTYYAQETRMYALVSLLSVVVAASFAATFAQRRRRWLPVFVASGSLLIYTHNWGLFLVTGSVVSFGWLWQRSSARRALLRDAGIGYGLIAPLLPALGPDAAGPGPAHRRAVGRAAVAQQHPQGDEVRARRSGRRS